MKAIIRAWGMNPEQMLTREALSQPAASYIKPEDQENRQLQILTETLKELIRKEAEQP